MNIKTARIAKRKRAVALGAVAGGQLPLREVLRDGHDALGSCPIWRLLVTAPTMGPESVRKTLERSNVYALLTLNELSKLQRMRIINELPRRVK